MPTSAEVERDLHAIGRELAGRFPPRTRHPLRAIDAKAMELSSQDAELRAALFRFVDVTPACRSLDDLARHLAGYLDEVETKPQPLRAAMRMAETRAGRTALGAAAAAGVRHMAHRFIVAETPRAAGGGLRSVWRGGHAAGGGRRTALDVARRHRRVARPARRGHGDPGGGRSLRRALRRRSRRAGA